MYLSIDECHFETFDFHCQNGHQVLLAIRYIKEILVNELSYPHSIKG